MALKQSSEEACQCHAAIKELQKEMEAMREEQRTMGDEQQAMRKDQRTMRDEQQAMRDEQQAMRQEQRTMRGEQQEIYEQLLSGLQILLGRDHEGLGPLKHSTSIKSVKRARPPKAPRGPSDQSGDQLSTSIPDVCELERSLMMSEAQKRSNSKYSAVQPLHPVSPNPQPPESEAPRVEHVDSFGRRGSTLGALNRNENSRILALSGLGPKNVWKIFEENIGVRMWLRWNTWMIWSIVLALVAYSATTVTLQLQGLQQAGEHFASFALLVYGIVAILFLKLVKRSLCSEALNIAMQQVDDFVSDCGRGLAWAVVAKKSWRRFLALWLLVLVAFATQQTLEVQMAEQILFQSHAGLRIARGVAGTVLFALSSAVVVNCAYWQATLVQGLQKSVDCWCSDIATDVDFAAGVDTWNRLQALLKCAAQEMTPCFVALTLFGYAGFLVSIAGSFSLLLGENLQGHRVALYEFALLPLVYLFFLSAQLLARGAGLSEKCRQVPSFVNQLPSEKECDARRQYLVSYISDSAAGFIVAGITLSQSALLKQLHLLTALCSGLGGILIRRYLADAS